MALVNKYTITKETFASLESLWKSRTDLRWDTLFTLPPWMNAWWQTLGRNGELHLITIRQDSLVLGVAPLIIKDGVASIVGSENVTDFKDFVVTPGYEMDFFNVLLNDLKEKDVSQLNLETVRKESTVLTNLAGIADKRGYGVNITEVDVCPAMDLPTTWESYLASLTSKQRHEVNRKLRRLYEAGEVNYSLITDELDVPAAMDTFIKLFVECREDKNIFMTPQMESFFRQLALTMAQEGLLKIGSLELDKTTIAMALCFDYDNVIYLYNSGYDPRYREVSAGLMSKVLSIKESIESGRKKYDFLKGDEDYKYQLGGKRIPLFSCNIAFK